MFGGRFGILALVVTPLVLAACASGSPSNPQEAVKATWDSLESGQRRDACNLMGSNVVGATAAFIADRAELLYPEFARDDLVEASLDLMTPADGIPGVCDLVTQDRNEGDDSNRSTEESQSPDTADKDSMAGFTELSLKLTGQSKRLDKANAAILRNCDRQTLRTSKCRKAAKSLLNVSTPIHLQILTDAVTGFPDGYRCRAVKTHESAVVVANGLESFLDQDGWSDLKLATDLAEASLEGIRLAGRLDDWRGYSTDSMQGIRCP